MELNIGHNIKQLRLQKGMTQEQVAALLCVSTAAVSKWESKNTYPDITLLLPLANIFGVSVDELLGHDVQKEQKEIDRLINECRLLEQNGRFDDANRMIASARNAYPHDYRIMRVYMWRLVGGENTATTNGLLEHRDELMQICECILDGCKTEQIRLDAMTVQAKLYYAAGETEKALQILREFPKNSQTAAIKLEQLYPRDSAEYRYYNKKNLYGLLDITANKAVRMIRYDESLLQNEKLLRIETLGDTLSALRRSMPLFAIPEQMVFAELASYLSILDDANDLIRVRKKQFEAMKAIRDHSKKDTVLKDCLLSTYQTEDPVAWLYEWLSHSSHEILARWRKNPAYLEMLSAYQNQ